jgi:hypothetical protein
MSGAKPFRGNAIGRHRFDASGSHITHNRRQESEKHLHEGIIFSSMRVGSSFGVPGGGAIFCSWVREPSAEASRINRGALVLASDNASRVS